MNAQKVLDVIIKPTLKEMESVGNYNTIDARMLMLSTYAIESILESERPKASGFNLNPSTIFNTARNWVAWPEVTPLVRKLSNIYDYGVSLSEECETNQRLACLVARGKYAMDKSRLPGFDDKRGLFDYYKRVYSTSESANFVKWCEAWKAFNLDEVEL